jgi:hypothetical protein
MGEQLAHPFNTNSNTGIQGQRWHLSISATGLCAAEHNQLANAASAATAPQSGKLQGVPFAVSRDARRSVPSPTYLKPSRGSAGNS